MRPSLQAISDRLEKLQDILRLIGHAENALSETKSRVDILSDPITCRKNWDAPVVLFGNLPKELHRLEIKRKALRYWIRRYNREVGMLGLPAIILSGLQVDINIPNNVKDMI